jgi:TRAP transporter TAXI family solute receptor
MVTTLLFMLLTAFAFATGGTEAAEAGEGEWQPPRGIVIRTTSPGGTGYAEASAIAAAIKQSTNVNVATPPTDSTLGQLLPIKQGDAIATWYTGDEVTFARDGTAMFEEWGPQSLRMLWFGTPLPQGFATQRNSGIETFADIVGRKVARVPDDDSDMISYQALFAYMDAHPDMPSVGWEDVQSVRVSGFTAGQEALLSGAVEVAIMSATSSTANELAASMNGIRWLSMPYDTAADKRAWEAWREIKPYDVPQFAFDETIAAGVRASIPESEKPWIFGWPFLVVGYDFYPDNDLAYWLVKTMDETHELYKDSHPQLQQWTVENMFNNVDGWMVPIHDGAIRYFKEIGAWTDAAQAKHEELLQQFPENTRE